jgi:hypothetical protein
MHAVAAYGTALPGVHQATILQTSQFGRGIWLGMVVGGLAGLIGGWLVITYPPPNLPIGNWVLAVCGVPGAVGGAMVGGILARDRLSPEILSYEAAILRGAVLLMVDVPRHEVEEITNLVRIHHPEAIPQITLSPRASNRPPGTEG